MTKNIQTTRRFVGIRRMILIKDISLALALSGVVVIASLAGV
jgi:hypothetical protein